MGGRRVACRIEIVSHGITLNWLASIRGRGQEDLVRWIISRQDKE